VLVYLDNCSTTKPRDEVIDEINYMLKESYGNPSSLHSLGLKTEKRIEDSRKIIADFLNVRKDEIFFTSGGTESNNIAIQGLVNRYKRKGNHLITTKVEHSSIFNIFKYYENHGFEVTFLDVDDKGNVDLEQLKNEIRKDTILVSIMVVNNELGAIEPVNEIRKIMEEKNSKALLHLDGVQAFGKIPINIRKWKVDTFAFSAHKIYGPKGIGGLYVKKEININPLVYGGQQERGLRSGTENTPGIVGMAKAVEIMGEKFEEERKHVYKLKTYFAEKILKEIEDIKINTSLDEGTSPYILNVSFLYTKGEVLLHYLEDKGIYVSTASACSSNAEDKSHVLKAIGLNENEIEGAIRFCFSYENTYKELDYTVEVLKRSVDEIRQIVKR